WDAVGAPGDLEYRIETARFPATRAFARSVLADLAIVDSAGLFADAEPKPCAASARATRSPGSSTGSSMQSIRSKPACDSIKPSLGSNTVCFSHRDGTAALAPKVPSKEITAAVVAMKQRNPSMGCRKALTSYRT
ncbi:MAG: hypothetical protein ACREXS_20365, partial [Gammaproteobacteria bacterium]